MSSHKFVNIFSEQLIPIEVKFLSNSIQRPFKYCSDVAALLPTWLGHEGVELCGPPGLSPVGLAHAVTLPHYYSGLLLVSGRKASRLASSCCMLNISSFILRDIQMLRAQDWRLDEFSLKDKKAVFH
jgi:hypothetical protein